MKRPRIFQRASVAHKAEYDKANQRVPWVGVGNGDNNPHFPSDTEGAPSRLQLNERPEPWLLRWTAWAHGKGKYVLERVFLLGKLIYPSHAKQNQCSGTDHALGDIPPCVTSSAHNAQCSVSCLYAKQFKFQVSCANPLMPLWHILGSSVWKVPHLTLSIFTHFKNKWAI